MAGRQSRRADPRRSRRGGNRRADADPAHGWRKDRRAAPQLRQLEGHNRSGPGQDRDRLHDRRRARDRRQLCRDSRSDRPLGQHHLHHRLRDPDGGLGARTGDGQPAPPGRRRTGRDHAWQCDVDRQGPGQRHRLCPCRHLHPRQSRGQRHHAGRGTGHWRDRHRPCRPGHFFGSIRGAEHRLRPAVPARRHDPLWRHYRDRRADRPQDHARPRSGRRASDHVQQEFARPADPQSRQRPCPAHLADLRNRLSHPARKAQFDARNRRGFGEGGQQLPPGPLLHQGAWCQRHRI